MAKLEGITKISRYMNRSDSTILGLIRAEGFPAKRTNAVWVADTKEIDKWQQNRPKMDTPARPVVTKSKKGTVKSKKK
jgi:hypothetical protein